MFKIFVLALIVTQLDVLLNISCRFLGYRVSLIIGVIYKFIKPIGVSFRLLNTLIHELGHGLMGIILGGKLNKIIINKDASGLASTSTDSSFKRFLVTSAGYPFASIISLIFILLIINQNYMYILYTLIGVLILSMFFFRNKFAFIWGFTFVGLLVGVDTVASADFEKNFVIFITCVLLIESVRSAFYILYLSIVDSKNSGDCSSMAKRTKIPAFIYGMYFASFSVVVAYKFVTLLFTV